MMNTVRKFLRRPPADRRLLAHALVLHVTVTALLRLVAHRRLTRWLDTAYAPSSAPAVKAEVERIAWAVRTASMLAPLGKSCLTEALTAQCLLRRRGHAAALRIGVARAAGASAPIAAHAWLEHADRVVVGGEVAPAYLPLQPARSVSEKSQHAPSRPAPPAKNCRNSCGRPARSALLGARGALLGRAPRALRGER